MAVHGGAADAQAAGHLAGVAPVEFGQHFLHQGLALGGRAAGDVGAAAGELGAQGVARLGQTARGQAGEFGLQVVKDAIDEV